MLIGYIKIALRNIYRNKVYSILNILGLSVGLGATILIYLWIKNELGMERFHKNIDTTYVMYIRDSLPSGDKWVGNWTSAKLAPTLKEKFPEVEKVSRLTYTRFLFTQKDTKVQSVGAFVDSDFIDIFSFPLKNGDGKQAFEDPFSILLTQSFAKTLFGDEDPIGKTVKIDSNYPFIVRGVLDDLPVNTLFRFNYLVPWSFAKVTAKEDLSWENNTTFTYVKLLVGTSQKDFDKKVKNVIIHNTEGLGNVVPFEVFTQPLSRFYLYGKAENGKLVGGNIITVRFFALIGFFILLIACINFMNLTTARSARRMKEIGVRKVVGVRRKALILQFITESTIISTISLVIGILGVIVFLPYFNSWANLELSIPYVKIDFWLSVLVYIVFTGLISGSFPALYFSSIPPIMILKGRTVQGSRILWTRRVLMILQFTVSMALISGTYVVYQQIGYVLDREIGYNTDQLIYVSTEGNIKDKYLEIRDELLSNKAIVSSTLNFSPITERWSDSWGFNWKGSSPEDENKVFMRMASDANLLETTGLSLIDGRDIDVYRFLSDSTSILINQAAANVMGFKDPIGQKVGMKNSDVSWIIVGVLENFIVESPFLKDIQPLIVHAPGVLPLNTMHMRLNPDNPVKENLLLIEDILQKFNPDYPFEYSFIDEHYERKFRSVKRTAVLVKLFALLSIFISCLGVFGLSIYMAESRSKELGVRKVLGANVIDIIYWMSKEYIVLIFISLTVACPFTWIIMNRWLENYSYKVEINSWMFLGAEMLTGLIALFIVGMQSMKMAMENSVRNLRDE